jgi:23S rRNA (guanosine2251-2'-O)-methyltransferase
MRGYQLDYRKNRQHPSPVPSPESGEGRRSTDFIYGRRPVWEVMRAGKRSLHKLWVVPGTAGGVIEEVLQWAKQKGVPIDWIRREHLDRMVHGNHQGIAAQVSSTQYLEIEDFLRDLPTGPCVVVGLDEIEDPQNVGAILRNAGFFGAAAVIVPRWRSAPVGDTAMRASAGAAEHVSVIRVRNLVHAIDQLKEASIEVWGADMDGSPIATAKASLTRDRRIALIMGAEGKGLRRLVKEHCDKLVQIPGKGAVQSLNVGSASAILLYELCH